MFLVYPPHSLSAVICAGVDCGLSRLGIASLGSLLLVALCGLTSSLPLIFWSFTMRSTAWLILL
jgi:hypothetical protein